ncbi:MAG TPA: hypothetical protein DCX54_05215, partial [Flavobacteriales bacterium]|nr:hypothetical protein [Flavobacteriales bacterium]
SSPVRTAKDKAAHFRERLFYFERRSSLLVPEVRNKKAKHREAMGLCYACQGPIVGPIEQSEIIPFTNKRICQSVKKSNNEPPKCGIVMLAKVQLFDPTGNQLKQ